MFFHNAYIAERDLQSSQHNASVESLLLAGYFLYKQKQPNEHPVQIIEICSFGVGKNRIKPVDGADEEVENKKNTQLR